MGERIHVDSFFSGDTTNAVSILSKGIATQELKLVRLVECTSPELLNDDVEVRANGARLLADVMHGLPSGCLNNAEGGHMARFFCNRLKDQHVVIPHVLYGLLALVRHQPLEGDLPSDIIRAINKEVHVQALIRVERSVVYNIIHALLENHLQALLTMGADFVFAFIQMMDGEQDPRNLVLAFNLVPTIAQRFPIDRFVEDLFDVTSCYFPISFSPQPDDPSAISQEQLCDALRACLCAVPVFGNLTLPLLLEKLTSNVASAKLESVVTLTAGAPVFGAAEIMPHIEGIWLAIRTEVFRSSSEVLVKACLDCITTLIKVLSLELSGAGLKDLMERILKECSHHYKQPQLGLSSISSRLLRAVCAGSATACSTVLSEVMPIIVEQYAIHTASASQCSLMDSLLALMSAAVVYYGQIPAEAVLATHLESLLSIIFTSVNDGDAQLRVFGCKCMEVLLGSENVMSDDQVSLCMELVVRTLASDESMDVRGYGQVLASCVCRHFPKTALASLIPSIAEWLVLRRTSCDAGLKPHLTEEYVLGLSAAMAVNIDVLPVLVKMWFDHLEFLTQSDWCDSLPARCLLLISALQAASKHGYQDTAMLLHIMQSLVSPIVQLLLSAAQSDVSSTKHRIFTNLAVVEATSAFVGSAVRNTEASWQTTLVTQLITEVSASDSFKPFEPSSVSHQQQCVVLLAAVIPCVLPANLPDGVFGLLSPSVNMAIHCAHSAAATAACVLCASLLNKLTDESALATALEIISSSIQSAWESGHTASTVPLLAWVTRGLLLRSHPESLAFTSKLIELFSNEESAADAAAAFSLLLNDENGRNLTAESGASVRFLHKQKFFVQVRPQLVDGFVQAVAGSVKECYLAALSHLLFAVPEQVLLTEIPPLLPLVVQCLSSSEPRLILSSLASITSLLRGSSDLLTSHVSNILPLLMELSRFKGNLKVRQMALRCLGLMTVLPHHLLYPYKDRVLQHLVSCLGDHKRLVRSEAVQCRGQWFLLGAASS